MAPDSVSERLKSIEERLWNLDRRDFHEIAMEIFRLQSQHNEIYKRFIEMVGVSPEKIKDIGEIPFLPVHFFKVGEVKTGTWKEEGVFMSSGTTSGIRSCHPVVSYDLYHRSVRHGFTYFFGSSPERYIHIAYVPNYMNNPQSSLLSMLSYFIEISGDGESGFVEDAYGLIHRVGELMRKSTEKRVIIWSTSYVIAEFATHHTLELDERFIVVETGGLKTSGWEITREELHALIKQKMKVKYVYSEYGMTELFSQCYARGLWFSCTPLIMPVLRDLYDPMCGVQRGKEGRLAFIDLANLYSCSFILTDDVAVMRKDNKFKYLGRVAESELRGCNLLTIPV